jgi:hypothetical protein
MSVVDLDSFLYSLTFIDQQMPSTTRNDQQTLMAANVRRRCRLRRRSYMPDKVPIPPPLKIEMLEDVANRYR